MELTWQSPAPTRAKMQSRTEMLALSQGTNEPTCAIKMFTPTCKCDKNRANFLPSKIKVNRIACKQTFNVCYCSDLIQG